MKLSRPFPSSAAPPSLLFVLRETFVQRFYTGASSMMDCFLWCSELHVTVLLFSDASTRAWSAVLFRHGRKSVSRDYWLSDPSTDVNLLESRALLNALVYLEGQFPNSRVDFHIDNKVLKSALNDDGCKNSAIIEVVKEIYRYSRDQNFNMRIQTFYLPSRHNPADEPSQKCSRPM